jgi:murein DD-endopeptidase MepM/ murein hydrolase activator NlpD
MRKLILIFLLSFGLSSFISNSATTFENDVELKNEVNLWNDFEFSKKLIINSLVEKNIEVSNFLNLPITSPIRTDSIKRIGDLYGMRQSHPILKISKFHKGIDIVANENTAIYSTSRGIVVYVNKSKYRYGNQIIIQHENGFQTRYAHLKEVFVQKNDSVDRYSILGLVGSSGLSTGPHLHYEILYKNKQIDPISLYSTLIAQNKKEDYLKILIKLEYFNSKQLLSY